MIDWNKSAELNGMMVEELKVWFEKYPRSGRRIIRICDKCNNGQNIPFDRHSGLCHACSVLTEEYRKKRVENTIKQFSTQEARDRQSEILIQFNIDHPEAGEAARLKSLEQWSDQSARDAMSEIKKNSESAKANAESMRGGNDICDHHYIYDHSDLLKYTMKMTRSAHQRLHWLMRKSSIIVPHINKGC